MARFDDFLLREIERFGQALAQVIQAREQDDDEAALEAASNGCRTLVGLSLSTLVRMPPDAIRPLLTLDGRLEVDRAAALALLIAESAELQPDPGLTHQHRTCAVGLLALTLPDQLPDGFTDTADALVRGVHLGALDGPTLSRLAPWFERRDRFDRAEDVIFAWFDKESAPAEAAGLAFYERLWGLPDARLRAGGLSSQEVLDGLADLQAKARTEGGSS